MPFAKPEEEPYPFAGSLVCPHCGKRHTEQRMLGDALARPSNGDISLCITCGQLGVFDLRLHAIRLPTAAEARKFDTLPEVIKARRAWRKVVAH